MIYIAALHEVSRGERVSGYLSWKYTRGVQNLVEIKYEAIELKYQKVIIIYAMNGRKLITQPTVFLGLGKGGYYLCNCGAGAKRSITYANEVRINST